MKKSGKDKELRRKAEEKVALQPSSTGETDAKRLLHELQVHQVELEMQNEELHLANQSLKEYKLHMQNLINMTPAGYFRLDGDDCFAAVNDAFLNMHGYDSSDEVVGKHFSMLQVDSGSDSALKHLEELHNGKAIPLGDFTSRHKDGSVGHHVFSAHPVLDSGRVVSFEWFIIDITKRVQAEEESLKLQGYLHQALKIESVGRLAGGVAHDFNNMLGVIVGHAELALKKAPPSSPLISDLEEIRKAASRSANLTRQLLTFARKQAISPKRLDLNEVVTETLKMLRCLIGENIQLLWDPAADLWPVMIDPSQIDQILTNLCVNSRDSISGSGTMSIKTANTSWDDDAIASLPYDVVPGDYVLLSVSDDGCGMDEKIQANIFEPFFTTKEVGSGTGLGLATVYGAVKQNHGFFTIDSEPGHGTVFNIYLPRTSKDVVAKEETAEAPLLSGTETILLIEDDEMLLNMATSMLKESGYTVLAAITTDLAQTIAKEHPGPIHLLISDVIMPVMNGKELSEKLMPLQPDMKVLFSSGYTADIISSQGIIEDKTNFLQKPFSFEALTAKVREVLDGH